MAVENFYSWRMFDKDGNVVADGLTPDKKHEGDFYLNDDGVFENKETGVSLSGDIQYVDENGDPINSNVEMGGIGGVDATITIINRGGNASNSKRAFGEIRTSSGIGSTPAFKEANNADKPKLENPEKPQTDTPPPPSSPPNNGSSSGGGLIGEISKQNEILKNLTSKVGQTTELNKISRGLDSLERSFKRSLDNLAKEVAKGSASIARSNEKGDISASVNSLKGSLDKLATVKEDLAKISENGKGLLDIEKDRHDYEKKPQTIKDLDGQDVANLSPRDAQTVKNITQAKTATDTNNFELDGSDIDDLFGNLPDITELFKFPLPGEIDREFMK
ncbi:hypothetical protein [Campylobacter sp. RM16187]|uniref:hypothetical protein n=1 Tax=Campylobacter sp. RM16187 TaxID=1660063 RepID=UPI0021B6C9AE|nr:hypothetical protein [Campylobacter sp. RM16187]QKG28772.1 hypothetical protein CDOMF_0490 [Campylobacter sp. RM16187]